MRNLAGLMSGNHRPAEEWKDATLLSCRGQVRTKSNGRKYVPVTIRVTGKSGRPMTAYGNLTLPELGDAPKIGDTVRALFAPFKNERGEMIAFFDVAVGNGADSNEDLLAEFG